MRGLQRFRWWAGTDELPPPAPAHIRAGRQDDPASTIELEQLQHSSTHPPQAESSSSHTRRSRRTLSAMEKARRLEAKRAAIPKRGWYFTGAGIVVLVLLATFPQLRFGQGSSSSTTQDPSLPQHLVEYARPNHQDSPYGRFPQANDPFHFLPCTSASILPPLDDPKAEQTWAALFDPEPAHWSWGDRSITEAAQNDPYSGRGIYLCGYLDVPLDYTNKSDDRIARLAVTKFQVSGLARVDATSASGAGKKSERTIVIEPGGPGGSGTSYAWRSAQNVTQRFSDSTFDVLGWDPRGVNASLPAVACILNDASRDHWSLLTSRHHVVLGNPRSQLEIVDALNHATMRACWERHGDLGRFLSTAFVARDLEEIRKALGEEELTGYLVSYGTGIGQTFAAMFPDSVGRIILDGTEYVRDHRERGGFGWTALDNATDAWRDGFLGECLNAGPEYCALARSKSNGPVVLSELDSRMKVLISGLQSRPAYHYDEKVGPTLVTYSALVDAIYGAMYNARSWPTLAKALSELEAGNATLAAAMLEDALWWYHPEEPCPLEPPLPSDSELHYLVVCADSYDASGPDDLEWWGSLWANMSTKSWIAGDSRFYSVLPCRHYNRYWPKPAEVYRGDLNKTLRHPVLLIAETYDPATPLRNGRRLLAEMGANARLIAHHGYGHSSRDTSACTDAIARAYIMEGKVPEKPETACYADEKPYLHGVKGGRGAVTVTAMRLEDHAKVWQEHLRGLAVWNPRLVRSGR